MSGRFWRWLDVVVFIVSMVLCFTGTVLGSALTEVVGQGEIDWEAGVIKVTGYGVPPAGVSGPQGRLLAQRAAKSDAQRNALEILVGVRVSSSTLVRDFTVINDTINTSVEGIVRGAVFEKVVCDLTETCAATLIVPLDGQGSLVNAVGGSVLEQLSTNAVTFSSGVATSIIINEPDQALPDAPTPRDPYAPISGIIIDARGLGVRPAMYPQVFDTQGRAVYTPANLDPDIAAQKSMVAYARSVENACTLVRVGQNPLVVKATAVVKATKGDITDIALDSAAAAAVREADKQGALLAQAAVVFVID